MDMTYTEDQIATVKVNLGNNEFMTCKGGWQWFDAVIKFKDGNICNYASTTNGSIEDAKKQAANVVIGQTAEILSIAFR